MNGACHLSERESRSSMGFEVVHDQSTWHLLSCPSNENNSNFQCRLSSLGDCALCSHASPSILKIHIRRYPTSHTIKWRLKTLFSHTCLKYKGVEACRQSVLKTASYSIANCHICTIYERGHTYLGAIPISSTNIIWALAWFAMHPNDKSWGMQFESE